MAHSRMLFAWSYRLLEAQPLLKPLVRGQVLRWYVHVVLLLCGVRLTEIGREHHARRNRCPAWCVTNTPTSPLLTFFSLIHSRYNCLRCIGGRVLVACQIQCTCSLPRHNGEKSTSCGQETTYYAFRHRLLHHMCIYSVSIYYTESSAGSNLNSFSDPFTVLLNSPMGGLDQSSQLSATLVCRALPWLIITLYLTLSLIDWLDGCMITLAIYILNFIHPGVWLKIADPTSHNSQLSADEEARRY